MFHISLFIIQIDKKNKGMCKSEVIKLQLRLQALMARKTLHRCHLKLSETIKTQQNKKSTNYFPFFFCFILLASFWQQTINIS